jgi:hypothetical protein
MPKGQLWYSLLTYQVVRIEVLAIVDTSQVPSVVFYCHAFLVFVNLGFMPLG